MKKKIENFPLTNEVVDAVLKDIANHKKGGYDQHQLNVMLQPTISNAIFHRDKEVLEHERFKTLIALARVLDDENMEKAIIGLNYTLTIEKK